MKSTDTRVLRFDSHRAFIRIIGHGAYFPTTRRTTTVADINSGLQAGPKRRRVEQNTNVIKSFNGPMHLGSCWCSKCVY